jgi:uncharacterized FAD-dependent dehydrogenase
MTQPIREEVSLDLGLDEAQDETALRRHVARRLGVPESDLPPLAVLKRALDARRGKVRFHLVVGPARDAGPLGQPPPRQIDDPGRVLIVGGGPAGLFCAYELARHGIGSTVLERGKPVQPRRRDLRGLHQEGRVDPDSNYCFGEGGAGTYSDGKLYTRAHKRGSVRDIIEILVAHGAPEAILVEARPHIGSNKLPRVVTALRTHLESVGVRFVFGARVAALLREPSGAAGGVRLADGSELGAEAIVLAVGHSARDVFARLVEDGVSLQSKGFAVGLRVEHPQALINRIQYGRHAGHPALPSAAYRLAHEEEGRGIFSFCMCPGGFIVPAATEVGGVVVNGMSLSRRDSPFANSGLVVSIEPEDLVRAGYTGPLGGIEYQRRLEQLADMAGGGGLRAPATRVTDFAAGRGSSTVGASSYPPGLNATDVAEVLDGAGIPIAARLRRALAIFDRRLRGYLTAEAVLVGVESRTSAPLRIPRDPESLQSTDLPRLYPCGEGAGYAGGIVSAALDGIRVADALARALAP